MDNKNSESYVCGIEYYKEQYKALMELLQSYNKSINIEEIAKDCNLNFQNSSESLNFNECFLLIAKTKAICLKNYCKALINLQEKINPKTEYEQIRFIAIRTHFLRNLSIYENTNSEPFIKKLLEINQIAISDLKEKAKDSEKMEQTIENELVQIMKNPKCQLCKEVESCCRWVSPSLKEYNGKFMCSDCIKKLSLIK